MSAWPMAKNMATPKRKAAFVVTKVSKASRSRSPSAREAAVRREIAEWSDGFDRRVARVQAEYDQLIASADRLMARMGLVSSKNGAVTPDAVESPPSDR